MDLQRLTVNWFFPEAPVTALSYRVWLVGDNAVCKAHTDKAALARELRLAGFLQEYGLPTPSTFQTVDELDWIAADGVFLCLAHRLPGAHLTDTLAAPEHTGALYGDALAALHDGLAAYPRPGDYEERDFIAELDGWVTERFPADIERGVFSASRAEFGTYYPALPRHLIHRDPHPQNLLFTGDRLTGVLDLELCRVDARLFDLCYLTTGLLCGKWRDADAFARWLAFLAAFVSAYDRARPLTDAEREAFVPLTVCIESLFVAYCAANPDEARENAEFAAFMWSKRDDIRAQL